MSLINDALKKAQKQRTGDTPSLTAMPSVGGESAARIARRGKPAGFNTMVIWIGVGVAALAVVIVGVVLLLRPKAPAPVTAPPVAKVAPATPAPQPVQPVAPPVIAPPTTTASVAPAPTLPAPSQVSAPVVTAPPIVASSTVVLAPAPAPEPAKPATPGVPRKLENRAINYINSIRVAGIRASGTDSKVLMNDRVYRIGDLVEAEMGLHLTGITTNSLTFEDEQGGRFTRNF